VQTLPPPLPRGLANPRPVIVVCTVIWFVTAAALLVIGTPAEWVWSCVVGGMLGLLGLTVMRLQRSAALRGSKGAQQGLL
jgi:hypothetical protein